MTSENWLLQICIIFLFQLTQAGALELPFSCPLRYLATKGCGIAECKTCIWRNPGQYQLDFELEMIKDTMEQEGSPGHCPFTCWTAASRPAQGLCLLVEAAGEKITAHQTVPGQEAEPCSDCMRWSMSHMGHLSPGEFGASHPSSSFFPKEDIKCN